MLTTTSVYMNHNHQFNIIACEQQHNNSNNPYNQRYKTELELSCEDNLITLIQTNSYTLTRPEVPSPWPINVPRDTCNRNSESTRSASLAAQLVPTTNKVVLVLILTHITKMAAKRHALNHITQKF